MSPAGQTPKRSNLGAFMRSPLGVLWREIVPVEMIICFVSVTFVDVFGFPQNSVNYYSGQSGSFYRADGARFDNTDAPVYIVLYPVATPYIDFGGGWNYPFYVGGALVSYIYHTIANTRIGIDEIYSSITDSDNQSNWPVYASWNGAAHQGHHDPARSPIADFTPTLTNCRFFIESSDSMSRSDLEPDISTLEANLDAAEVSYSQTIFPGSGIAENQGRWLDWLATHFGY